MTYVMQLASTIREEIGGAYAVSDEHFTAEGIAMTVTDPVDGQRYELEIKPAKEVSRV